MKYKYIENFLGSIFSVQTGLSEDEEEAMLESVLRDEKHLSVLEKEFTEAFLDPDISWSALLCNERYEVYESDDEEDAKDYVVEYFWKKLFPEKPLPRN
ncbi:MAG: hypothetical protein AAGB12_16685 [Pseudomonadota bacterium]